MCDMTLGPMSKLYSGEASVRLASEFVDMIGADCIPPQSSADEPGRMIEQVYRVSPGTTTYGGTSEVMRSLIAEHHLGLPRSR